MTQAVAEQQDTAQANTLNFELSHKQGLALSALADYSIDEVLYGGAKGGGKSVFGCIWTYLKAKNIIKKFDLSPSKYPPVVGFMGRKVDKDFRETTLESWKRIINPAAYELKKQEHLIVIENTVAIRYGGFDDAEESNQKKFNSAEYGFYFVDQAEELSEQDIGLIRGTLRLKLNNKPLNYRGLLTANPRICWLKDAFISYPQPRTCFIQALPTDNPFLPPNYIDTLKKAFEFRPELLRAYLYGSWDELDAGNVVIPIEDVRRNVGNHIPNYKYLYKITVADIADEGDDETVIYDLINTKIVNQEIYKHKTLMDTVGRLQAHARQNGSNMIAVDRVGLGAGVEERLIEIYAQADKKELEMEIFGFDGRVRADDPETFFNHNIEAWWYAAQQFKESKCDIVDDPILQSQLSQVQYYFKSNEKLALLPKDKLKQILKCSPDRAKTYVMGLGALKRATPVKKRDAYAKDVDFDDSYDYPFNPNTC